MGENYDLSLLAGLPILVGEIPIKPLILRDIAKLGEYTYNSLLTTLCIDKEDISETFQIEQKYDDTFDFLWDQLLNGDIQMQTLIYTAFQIFIGNIEIGVSQDNKRFFYIGDLSKPNECMYITKENFNDIIKIIKNQNCIMDKTEEEPPVFANKLAEEMWKKCRENDKKIQKAKPQEVNLHSMISGIAWKSSIGIDKIFDLTIYQIYDAYSRLGLIDEYDKTLNSVYAGVMESKKLDMKKINYVKIIKSENNS